VAGIVGESVRLTGIRVVVVSADTGNVVNELALENVYEVEFSPLGTYLITWQRPSKDETGNATKNLKIWRTADASPDQQPIGGFVQKNQTGWNLQWTADGNEAASKSLEKDSDGICARMVTNEVHYLKVDSQVALTEKLIVEGCSEFALCPTDASPIAVFVPGKQGTMSTAKVFGPVYRNPDKKKVENEKSFWNADKIQFKWDNKGAYLIVLAQTDVDKSNKSYYGNTFLYVLDRTGKVNEQVVLGK
jgi:translation initiation factor 2A